jgi:CRP-like cAMP-binding protein
MTITITREEWLAELERVLVPPTGTLDGLTATEIAVQSGITRSRVMVLLGRASAQGQLQIGRKPVTAIDGRLSMVPCYRLKVARKAAKRR